MDIKTAAVRYSAEATLAAFHAQVAKESQEEAAKALNDLIEATGAENGLQAIGIAQELGFL